MNWWSSIGWGNSSKPSNSQPRPLQNTGPTSSSSRFSAGAAKTASAGAALITPLPNATNNTPPLPSPPLNSTTLPPLSSPSLTVRDSALTATPSTTRHTASSPHNIPITTPLNSSSTISTSNINGPEIDLHIRPIGSKGIIPITVNNNATIAQMHAKVAEQNPNNDPNQSILLLSGTILKGDRTVAFYGLERNSVVMVKRILKPEF